MTVLHHPGGLFESAAPIETDFHQPVQHRYDSAATVYHNFGTSRFFTRYIQLRLHPGCDLLGV
jgi:hypothetical protein